MNSKKVSVLVPLYNEENCIGIVLSKLQTLDFINEIIVVDDASTDTSLSIAKTFESPKIKIVSLPQNSGKTAAINKAIDLASGDIFVIQDSDLEYDPSELHDVLWPILEDKADVVYGSRFMVKKAARVLYFYHFLANKFLTFLSNMLTNVNMTDIETCYKAFRAPIVKGLGLSASRFGMEVELTALFTKLPLRIYEVPISYYGRTYGEGKKIGFKDGIMAIYYIFYYNLIYPRQKNVRKHLENTRTILKI